MKIISTISGVIFTLGFSFSQIPNSGFEDWASLGNYEDPEEWITMNSSCDGPFYSATKSSDHYPAGVGSYSIRIENNTSLTQETGGWGVIGTELSYPFEPSFEITGHPTTLHGYYKFNSMNGDEVNIILILFDDGVIVSQNTEQLPDTGGEWMAFTEEIDPYSTADSATIIISAWLPQGPVDPPNGNSVLFIDNLNFDSPVSSLTELSDVNNFQFFPNPANDVITIKTSSIGGVLSMYSESGCLLKSITLSTKSEQIPVELSQGIYILELKEEKGVSRKKLVIH